MPSIPHRPTHAALALSIVLPVALSATSTRADLTPAAGFTSETVISGLEDPTGLAFAGPDRLLVARQPGVVEVVADGTLQATPLLDLRDEVGFGWDRGLLAVAVDPAFELTRFVYLLLVVDPIPGRPDEPSHTPAFGRLVRYTAVERGGMLVADAASRTVLLGHGPDDGIPCCYRSHSVGDLAFALDGSLFVSTGDGANFNTIDAGGDAACAALFGEDLDIGSFRAQSLDSMAGKVLRIDPATGLGLEDNPFFDGDPDSVRARIWATGLRNPFRISIDEDGATPGDLLVADVGWNLREEVSRVVGGENLGWPCLEGLEPPVGYPAIDLPAWDCASVETPDNPGPLTDPVLQWHHGDPTQSVPPGIIGRCAIVGPRVTHAGAPPRLAGRLVIADHIDSWIRAVEWNDDGTVESVVTVATNAERPVDLVLDPVTGDLLSLGALTGAIHRIRGAHPDLDGDGLVDGADLALLLAAWGSTGPADFDGSGSVDGADVGILLGSWTK